MEHLLRLSVPSKRITNITHNRRHYVIAIHSSLNSNGLLNQNITKYHFLNNNNIILSSIISREYQTITAIQRINNNKTIRTNKNLIVVPNHNNNNINNIITIQRRSKVFVSSYNQLNITSNDIQEFCVQNGLEETKVTTTHVQIKECPFCTKPTNNKQDNFYKLYISIGNGMYYCFRCGSKGSWYDFKRNVGGFNVFSPNNNICSPATTTPSLSTNPIMNGNDVSKASLPIPEKRQNALYIANLSRTENQWVMDYMLMKRGLKPETLQTYGVGTSKYKFKSDNNVWEDCPCVTFPWISRVSEIQEQEDLRGGVFHWKEGEVTEEEEMFTEQNNDKKQINKKVSKIWMNTYNKLKSYKQLVGHCNVPIQYDDDPKLARWVRKQRKQHMLFENSKSSSIGPEHIKLLEDVGFEWSDRVANTKDSSSPQVTTDPWITRRIKARSLHNKGWQRLEPKGGGWGLFGWHTVPSSAKEIIITEGEYDAMAVYQATGKPAISLPNGCRSLPVEVLPLLERFEKIYLWMDNDGPGQEGAKLFANKLGISRCYLVKPNETGHPYVPKDANDALLKNVNMDEMIRNAKVTPHERVISLEDIMPDVLHEIRNPDDYMGDPVTSLPNLTKIIKGFRRGELTVFSGATGSGKTTFLCQVSLDFAKQDINTLWGSFEIKNSRLIHKIFHQHLQKPLPIGNLNNNPEANQALDYLSSQFAELPLYFMTFHGSSDVDDVLNAMDYSVYVHDVKHIFLDNLQFMLSRNKGGNWDKFDVQDQALEKFRKFASERNVHITLVVHPRKEEEGMKLGMNSIYGSAKATQEADTVMILQTEGGRKYVEVKKNRYDGSLGSCSLFFQKESCRYSDRPLNGIDASKYIRA